MKTLIFREHALLRMAERGIRHQDVRAALEQGEAIRHYPEDTPYPSRLLLYWMDGQPLHVVAAPAGDDADRTRLDQAAHAAAVAGRAGRRLGRRRGVDGDDAVGGAVGRGHRQPAAPRASRASSPMRRSAAR